MIQLVTMAEEDYQAYLEKTIPEYAAEHVRAGNWDEKGALERSRKEFDGYLPQGLKTPHHFICTLVNEDHEKVGWLWYWINPEKPTDSFIYDFLIYDQYRRKGYGEQALRALESILKPQGVRKIGLHVFGANTPARELYKKLGYIESNVMMTREI